MNRRGFLGAMLAAGAAPAVVRASSLMKVSGIIIPTTEEVMTITGAFVSTGAFRSLLTPSIITREALRILEQNLVMANSVNRSWENQFLNIGDKISIRRPH